MTFKRRNGSDNNYIPIWPLKVEELDLWQKRREVFKMTRPEDKKKTCAPAVYGKMLNEEQKQQILCPLSSTKSSVLRVSGSISEKMIDSNQNSCMGSS